MPEHEVVQPVSRETTASYIANQIRRGIMTGGFPPGTQLAENDLANQFEVSRGPLREAMQRLVQEGLLYGERHRGHSVITLDVEDIGDVYLARDAIERAAIGVLVERSGDDIAGLLEPLEDAQHRMERARSEGESAALVDADLEFHEALVLASGSKRLVRTHQTLLAETRMCLVDLEPVHETEAHIVDDHRGILDALRANDETTALTILDAHMEDARKRVLRSHEQAGAT